MRNDIQFLRGVAVLTVVLFHAGVGVFKAGYLGVDIFFVISGFLITTIILRELEDGDFSFNKFYLRRAKRLLPAVYCTLTVTSLVGYCFLTKTGWTDYFAQLLGAVTFTANLVLPLQTGYFDAAAEGKPLLHMWSLSVEEQYYLVMPWLLTITAPRFRVWLLVAAAVTSFVLCVLLVSFPIHYWRIPAVNSDGWAFYIFPTRAWELLAGSLVAWWMLRHPQFNVPRWAKLLALLTLLVSVVWKFDPVHPRCGALVAVVATALMVAGRDGWLPQSKAVRAIEHVGDWSYSLYLVHWPIFAFAYLAWLGRVPDAIKLALVVLALALAWLQYRFVEQPFRFGWQTRARSTWLWLGAATLGVFLVPGPAYLGTAGANTGHGSMAAAMREANYGLSEACTNYTGFSVAPACQTGATPRIAVWGDSFAMHLMPGLAALPAMQGNLVQVTKSSCGPVLGMAAMNGKKSAAWARGCIEFNDAALDYIRRSSAVDTVILAGRFDVYFNDAGREFADRTGPRPVDEHYVVERLVETVDALRAAGKTVVVVSSTPQAGFDIGACLERKALGLVFFGAKDCRLDRSAYLAFMSNTIKRLDEAAQRGHFELVRLDEVLCTDQTCATQIGDVPIYRDEGHLSAAGSRLVMARIDWQRHFSAAGGSPASRQATPGE